MKNNILNKILCASVLMALNCPFANAQGIINTIAGTGIASFSGDGGPAIGATFSYPSGVATDPGGNIYIADYYNHRVRKIDIGTATISTVAGSGLGFYSGMGGPALAAGMEYPNSMFVDATGNYYLTDFYADCSYMVNGGTGIINNDCGNGNQGGTGDGGPGPLATMMLPKSIWKDGTGNTYIADYGGNKIRMMNPAHIVNTLTGGAHGFSPNGTLASVCAWGSIDGVCADELGNVYVSDARNHVVRKIDHATHKVNTIAGTGVGGYAGDGGFAVAAKLSSPGCLFLNSAGNLFICDIGNHTVRVMNIHMNASIIKTLAGTGTMGFAGDGGPANVAALNQPSGVWENATGTIYIADMGNQRIRSIVGSGYKSVNGLAGTTTSANMNIYPNPSNGTFTLLTDNVQNNTVLEVYNIMGQKVHTESVTLPMTTISLNQPAGTYNVVLKSSTGATTQKIVIEK